MGMIFTVVPEGPRFDPFLFSNRILHVETWCYHLWEHVTFVLMALVIKTEVRDYRLFFDGFFWFLCIDLADYILTYNEAWYTIGRVEITWNIIGPILLGLTIMYDSRNSK